MTTAGVKIDAGDKAAVMAILGGIRKGYEKAMTRALNKGLGKAKTEVKSAIMEKTNVKSTYLNKGLFENKASYSKLGASLSANKKPIALTGFFKTSQTNKGVNTQIYKGSKKFWKGAFIAKIKGEDKEGVSYEKTHVLSRPDYNGSGKMPKGRKAKFIPLGRGEVKGVKPNIYRLPTKTHYGPSASGLIDGAKNNALERGKTVGGIECQNELARQTELILRQSI